MNKTPRIMAAIFAGALSLGAAGGAMAATHGHLTQGYQSSFAPIKAVSGGTVTLADGTSYVVPYGYDTAKLKPGERVAITWIDNGGTRIASTIVIG